MTAIARRQRQDQKDTNYLKDKKNLTNRPLVAILVFILAMTSMARADRIWDTLVVDSNPSAPLSLAVRDLHRYLAQAGRTVPRLVTPRQWEAAPCPAVRLELAAESQPAGYSEEQKQGYSLLNEKFHGIPVVVVRARYHIGLVNGIYGLLGELGFGFFLGSETVPDTLPLTPPFTVITRTPAQRIRGVLPWYNFFNSPTTWDPVDHRTFVDQLIRCGANFVGFHTYDAEPFGGFFENGKVILGSRLLNTAQPTWGTEPTRTEDFAFGTDKFYAQNYFGARTTELNEPMPVVVQKEQDILCDALCYAKARGLKTCIGFEIYRNPLDPVESEVFLKRLNHVLDQYPDVDYLWLWQPECWGASGFEEYRKGDPGVAELMNLAADRRVLFDRLLNDRAAGVAPFFKRSEQGRLNRAMEGARLEQYAVLARRAMQKRMRAPRLVISGWGGDTRILSAEYYEGLDKLLPKDVVFSSLDVIGPIRRVDAVYNELPPDRERWPIPWLENDGDQWMPQPYVDIYQDLMKVLQQGGSQGVLGIHWRTRCIEESLQFLLDAAWNPGLRSEAYFKDFARRRYAPAISAEMSDLHLKLDRLPYRWIGGQGQTECGPFSWGALGPQKAADELKALHDRCVTLLPKAGYGRPQLEWLIGRMGYVLAWRHVEANALAAEKLLGEGKFGEALDRLDRPDIAEALRCYARNLSTRGEHGVLATINSKAVVSWRALRAKALAGLGKNEPEPFREWRPQPAVVLPRLVGSVAQGDPLELEPVVLGGGGAWLHYRSVGDGVWKTIPLARKRGWVQQGIIPADAVKPPGVEVAFSFGGKPEAGFAYGPVAVTVMPPSRPQARNAPKAVKPAGAVTGLTVAMNGRLPLHVRWADVPDADFYRVYRDGQLLCAAATPDLPDKPERPEGMYQVQAVVGGIPGPMSPAVAFKFGKKGSASAPRPATASDSRPTAAHPTNH